MTALSSDLIDAPPAVIWLLQTPTGRRIEQRTYSRHESLHAPRLLDLEFTEVVRRLLREGSISMRRADEALEDLADLRITRYPHFVFLSRIWGHRHLLSAYDAAYVALAKSLRAALITCDSRIVSASAHTVKIELF